MEKRDYILYCHTNKTNGKRYFGITNDIEHRWKKDGYCYLHNGQRAFAGAIQKYGWDGFKHIIIATGLTHSEACEAEKDHIRKYKTNICRYGNQFGYNMTDGGEGVPGRKCSDEHRTKTSKALMGNKNGLNHTVSEETRKHISSALTGHTISEQTRKKISETLSNRDNNPNCRAVICLDTNVVYRSLADVVSTLGIASSSISQCCTHRRATAGGYRWAYYSEMCAR